MRTKTRPISIATERLQLRSWRAGDATHFDQACNTAAVMKWLGGVQTRRQLSRDVRHFARHEAQHGFTFWAVERSADNWFLGFCGLLQIAERDCPFRGATEIGWRIRQDVWRHGYAYEAAAAVLNVSFTEYAFSSIMSRAAVGNTPSRRLMRKLGMTQRPQLDYEARDGTDLAVYSITQEQWRGVEGADELN